MAMDTTIKKSIGKVETDLKQAREDLTRAIADHVDHHSRATRQAVSDARARVLHLEQEYKQAYMLRLERVAAKQPKRRLFSWM